MARPATIFALSSGHGRAGVSVIRVSGPQTRAILESVAGGVPAARMAALRTLADPASGEVVDTSLVLFFPGPASFTGDDVAEFHVHGSIAVIRRLLRILDEWRDCGLADAGEFTRRALLNGKTDLLDVEALSDLLSAETESQRKFAVTGARAMRATCESWRSRLVALRALTEAHIDFSDEGDVEEGADLVDSETEREILELEADVNAAARTLRLSDRIRQGFRVTVLGPTNAGKSSLVNAIARRSVAIVSDRPGTTRDLVEAQVDLDGVAVILTDSAGIRETDDVVEAEGVRRALDVAALSDLVIWANPVDSDTICPNEHYLEVRTKADLRPDTRGHAISTVSGEGLTGLIQHIRLLALDGVEDIGRSGLVRSERQASALKNVAASLREAAAARGHTLDIRAEELRAACDYLDAFVGRVDADEVLGAIFSRFCIGK